MDTQSGTLLADRIRIPTPQPATPQAVAGAIRHIADAFEWAGAIGCGLPCAVRDGITLTAYALDPDWISLDAANYSLTAPSSRASCVSVHQGVWIRPVDALLDTSVVVDLWRRHPPALSWAEAHREFVIGIHVLVAIELVDGVRGSEELVHIDRLLVGYEVVYLTPSDCAWASEQHRRLRLSHGVGVIDALIASSAVRLDTPLYTLNLKHFQPLPDVKAVRPY